jgi:hypothetical protein
VNHGGKRKRAGRPSGPDKVYWAIRVTPYQLRYIRWEAKKYRMAYGAFVYTCVKNYHG